MSSLVEFQNELPSTITIPGEISGIIDAPKFGYPELLQVCSIIHSSAARLAGIPEDLANPRVVLSFLDDEQTALYSLTPDSTPNGVVYGFGIDYVTPTRGLLRDMSFTYDHGRWTTTVSSGNRPTLRTIGRSLIEAAQNSNYTKVLQ